MRRTLPRPYLLMALLLVGVLALGACTLPERPNVVTVPETEAGANTGVVTDTVGAPMAGIAGVTNAQNVLVTASSLLDLDFQNQAGENIGEIENFIVNMQTGQIPYATIEYGGVLEIGDKEVAVPLTAFDWAANGALMLNVDEQVLENYPTLGADWANFQDPAWDDQLFDFWQGVGVTPGYENVAEASNNLVWASDVVGTGVADIGFGGATINNMLIDLGQGVAQYAVLAYEPGVFTNELVAVPFSAFTWQGVGNDLLFADGITQDVLTAAPSFAAADLDTGIFDATWDDNLATYWDNAGFAVLPGVAANQAVVQPAQEAVTAPAEALGVVGADNSYILGTTLLDYDFESIDGGTSGEIEDVIVDTSNGHVLFVTVEYGGFLEIGDTELPMPLSAFGVGPEGRLVLRFRDEVLENFPDLGTDWGDFTNPAWEDQVVAFWRNAGFDPGFDITEATNTIVRASTLIGYPVADIGYGVSNVRNMVVNLGQGTVSYVLVDYDTLGVGDELVAVPFSAFDPGRFGSELAFADGVDRTILETAPIVDPAALGTRPFDPTLLDNWATYWEDHGVRVMEE